MTTIKVVVAAFVERLLDRCCRRFDIGRRGSPYLTRWTLYGDRFHDGARVFIHRFHRSDEDEAAHDHPWRYTSLVLWPGYWEEDAAGRWRWYGPLSLLRRKATWQHRVHVLPGRGCWTLVVANAREREWGFACPNGWRPWSSFLAAADAGLNPCGDHQ